MATKIASITYTQRKNLGNWEHQEVKVEVMPDEGETAAACMAKVKSFVDYTLNYEERHAKFKELSLELTQEGIRPERAQAINKWIENYKQWKLSAESLANPASLNN